MSATTDVNHDEVPPALKQKLLDQTAPAREAAARRRQERLDEATAIGIAAQQAQSQGFPGATFPARVKSISQAASGSAIISLEVNPAFIAQVMLLWPTTHMLLDVEFARPEDA